MLHASISSPEHCKNSEFSVFSLNMSEFCYKKSMIKVMKAMMIPYNDFKIKCFGDYITTVHMRKFLIILIGAGGGGMVISPNAATGFSPWLKRAVSFSSSSMSSEISLVIGA